MFRHALASKGVQNFLTDSRNTRRPFVSKCFEPIQTARKQTGSQHSQTHRGVRLQILHMKYKWRALERCDEPSCCAEKQRRGNKHIKIRDRKSVGEGKS